MENWRTAERVVDARLIEPDVRHELILQIFRNLSPDGGFQVLNDHDPKPLQDQFEARFADRFSWTYLEEGPEVWWVRIGRACPHNGNGNRA